MKVYYHPGEQGYWPRHSFFNGTHVPYPDVPGRTRGIVAALSGQPRFEILAPPAVGEEALREVHGGGFVETMKAVCGRLGEEEEFFPFLARPNPLLLESPYPRIRMGYYSVDGSTPLLSGSFAAALAAAASALAGAEALVGGEPIAYGIPRPPGHHAGRDFFAGYCLFNHAALAAARLLERGKVAILDVDFHHGNGTQDIFYERDDVLYVSIHCDPREAYPYIAGGRDETGSGKGAGLNVNLPLPGGTDWAAYEPALESALEQVARFAPETVVLSAGFDTLADDPIGAFELEIEQMESIGAMVKGIGKPLLVLQEGGYHVPSLGPCALKLFTGLGVVE
jgi:acetoin utilization deacetylase AcuC-like enzyme